MRRVDQLLAALGFACCLLGTPAVGVAEDVAAVRDALRQMRNETLDQLYKEVPRARMQVRSAAGYGVFGAAGVHILFVGGSGGRGVTWGIF